ncbi:DUF2798 domain-containing protein [Companilactobacillus sp. RD055328]|uniref:DUF2798 domain-containing protein n=1 Tax=Companilactobacillus sp. RD055328 TaxID=2916634 RepID=UPI001FC81025|nr:DUF2798 domain-containing protein [Companilactobacillus sp. RD055328]GKQ42388.1 DUF2798 domain-containing protein [Companilactobacillus sp. RD055328]
MPTNKKEGIIFGSIMCFLMVLGMSIYNLVLHQSFTFINLVTGFIPGFIVAFILDNLIVGVIAHWLVSKMSFIDKQNRIQLILSMSCLMVLGMVSFMSLFGIIIEGGIPNNLGSVYVQTWIMNLIAALPLQLLVVGPFSRTILARIQTK